MRPLKIAIFTESFLPKFAGTQLFHHNLALRFLERGHEPVIVLPRRLVRKMRDVGLRVPYEVIGLPSKMFRLIRRHPRYGHLAFAILLNRVQRRERFDLWHCTRSFPTGAALVYFSERFQRVPVVVRCAGEDIQKRADIQYGIRLDPKIDKIVGEYLPRAQRLVALTDQVVEEYRGLSIPESRIVKIGCGIDCERFRVVDGTRSELRRKLGLPEEEFLFLNTGRNHPKKGLARLVESAAILRRRCPDLRFRVLLVGAGVAELGPLAEARGIADRFIFRDEVKAAHDAHGVPQAPSKELRAIYHAADCFVFPTLIETFGNVLIEAMAAGLPILSTDADGARDVCGYGDYARLVPVADPTAFAEAMQQLAEDPGERERLGRLALERARHYDWSVIVDAYLKLYEEVIRERRSESSRSAI